MQPTLSVILPFYNRADLLATTLDSILAQTYRDFELIGVDDGSTDNASAIFQTYVDRDPRCHLYHQPHSNAGTARNLGYAHSRGEYLFFLDADDTFEPDYFATMLTTLQNENSDLVACTADEFDHQTGAIVRLRNFRNITLTQPVTTFTQAEFRPYLFDVMRPAAWNRLFRRAIIEKHQLRFQSLPSNNDMFFVFAYLIYAPRVTLLDRVLVHHRVNDARSLSAPENLAVDKFNRCLALDALRQQIPPAIFQPVEPYYYTFYFQKILDGIRRSTYAQGARIFRHVQDFLPAHVPEPSPQRWPMHYQFFHCLQAHAFPTFYEYLSENRLLNIKTSHSTSPVTTAQIPVTFSKSTRQTPRKNRILIMISHLSNGGAERVVPLWTKMLVNAGYQVTVLTIYSRPNEYQLDPSVQRVNLFPELEKYKLSIDKKAMCKNLFEQFLSQHPQDLIIPHLEFANLISSLRHQNHEIVTQTILNSPWDNERDFNLILRDWAIQKQGSVILQNAEQMAYFNTPQFKHVKKYIVHNPINPEIETIKKDHYKAIKKIAAVGRLVPQKNHALMIETIRILRDEFHENYQLDIYGVGELQASLQAQIDAAHLQNQVKLCGRSEDIFPVLVHYDLFLMTSLFEGTPNALLEAMGLGLPALAVKCRTGITELIDDGKNGYIVATHDARALAQRIRAINNPQQLAKIGQQARQDMLARYASPKIQQALVVAVQDLIQNPPKVTNPPIPFTTQIDDYQNYFETSLRVLKIADRTYAEQIFQHADHTLQNINLTIDPDNFTKTFYASCLKRHQFDKFYTYLQDKLYSH